MKKLVVFLLVALFGSQVFGQSFVGTISYDGFQKITKGAFWSTRPEAKIVYEGGLPSGVDTIVLKRDCYVRFIESEHNRFDGNYIIFPKGEKLYIKGSHLYAAICGNEVADYDYRDKEVQQQEKLAERPAPAPEMKPKPVVQVRERTGGIVVINNYYSESNRQQVYYDNQPYYSNRNGSALGFVGGLAVGALLNSSGSRYHNYGGCNHGYNNYSRQSSYGGGRSYPSSNRGSMSSGRGSYGGGSVTPSRGSMSGGRGTSGGSGSGGGGRGN